MRSKLKATILVAIAVSVLSSMFVYAQDPSGSEANPYEGLPSPTILVTGLDESGDLIYCGVDVAIFQYEPAIGAYKAKAEKVKRIITTSTEITIDLGSKRDYAKGVNHFVAIRTLYTPAGVDGSHGETIIIADESGATEGWHKIPNSYFILSFFLNWKETGEEGVLWHTDTWAANLNRYNQSKVEAYGGSAEQRSGDTFWLGEKLMVRVVTDELVDSLSAVINPGINEYRLDISGGSYEEIEGEEGPLYVFKGELWSPDMYTSETWGNGGKEPIKVHLQIKQGEISEDRAITIYFDNREPFYRLRKDF